MRLFSKLRILLFLALLLASVGTGGAFADPKPVASAQNQERKQTSVVLVAEKEIRVGKPLVVEGPSPTPPFMVVFEDDGSTGYFYALDMSIKDDPIVDALHIYDVASVSDRRLPFKIRIFWSKDGQKAALLINKYPHAIFDFEARRGYCRTGFPPPASPGWIQHDHKWDDKALELFR